MIENCLYGVKVFSDFALFGRPVPLTAVAPGERQALNFMQLPDTGELPELPEALLLYQARGREWWLYSDRLLGRSIPGQPWQVGVAGLVNFHWRGGDSTLYYQAEQECTQELLVFWFVHIFLPLYLTLERGYDFIHAAAVEVADEPILFIAPSTGGKSTLGDYFLKRGHPMLSDDKVATFLHEGKFFAVPSHPHHRPFRQVEVLGYPVEHFATCARPIHACYLLEQGEPDDAVAISEVTGFRKFEELLPHYLFSFSFLQQQRLRWLAQLADQSLVFRVHRPWNLDRQQEVYDAICAHSCSLPSTVSSRVRHLPGE